jgi:transposase
MRPKGTAAELERRRRRAIELVEQGESPTVVARILGVRTASLHRWRRLAQQPHGLDAKPIPGRPPQLSDYHLRKLERLLRHGAKKHGWPNDPWTADRVARLLRQRLGVSFHPEHVRKIHSKSQVVQEWLSKHPDVVVEDFPGDAPELNPDEWVWSWSKYGRLSNLAAC